MGAHDSMTINYNHYSKWMVAHFTNSLVLGTRSTFTLVSYIWERDNGGKR